MVILIRFLFLFIFITFGLGAATVNIDASIDQNTGLENTPIEGTITITHAKIEEIDTGSFILGKKPVTPTFVKENVITPETIVTIFSFNLSGEAAGLYILPSLSAKVGTKTYQSVPSSYEVIRTGGNPAPAIGNRSFPKTPQVQSPATLRLEAKVKGPANLYPGQQTALFYRISYNRDIDLNQSNLPFVQPKDFQKIGDAHVKDYQETLYTIQEITQEIEALQPGHFQFGPSSIQGFTYEIDALGQKVYNPTPLHAEAPVIELVVNPFPANQPSTFNGALGSLQASLKMTTPNTVNRGAKVNLILAISGISNLSELKLPSLACQPGFSGFFLLNDLPPAAESKEGIKEFQIELTPLTTLIQAIPSIEISSFDPASGKYRVQSTDPIPLTVKEISSPEMTVQNVVVKESTPDWNKIWKAPFQQAPPLELKDPFIPTVVSPLPWTHTSWVLLLIPLGTLFLLLVDGWHHYWLTRPKKIKLRSTALMEQAFTDKTLTPLQAIHLIELAFWWRLKEKGFTENAPTDLEKLPMEGWVGQTRSFILRLQTLEYSENKDFTLSEIKQEAKDLLI